MWIKPDTSSTRWRRRVAFCVDFLSGSSPNDVSLNLTQLSDVFWDNVRTDGYDLRVTGADGITAITFERDSWSKANRTGVLEIDNMPFSTTDIMANGWLYFDHTGTPSDVSTSVTLSSAKTAYMLMQGQIPADNVVVWRPERRGATKPRHIVVKQAGETIYVWFDMSRALQRFARAQHGSVLFEEIDYVKFEVLDVASAQAGMFEEGTTRIQHPALVRCLVKAGSSGSDYTASLTVATSEGRVLNPRALIKVQTVSD